MAVGLWGIQPSEFWGMTLWEWWAVYDSKVIETTKERFDEETKERLFELLEHGFVK